MADLQVKIASSILAADFSCLATEIQAIQKAGTDWIHIDVMDGHFVPNLTIGPVVCSSIRKIVSGQMDVHLMISPVDDYIPAFAKAGADIITIHVEATNHLDRSLELIRSLGCKAGVALNPATPEACVSYLIDKVDLILIMTVNPGFGGQEFIASQYHKIARTREMIADRDIYLEVDGGITQDTAAKAVTAGANVLVAGSAIFAGGAPHYAANIAAIKRTITN